MNLPADNGLSKEERLHGKNSISALLAKGRYGNVPGLRYCFHRESGMEHPRLLISVSKKYFKRAVKRNLLKRRIREAYRRLKGGLPAGTDLMIIYSTKEILEYSEIYSSVEKIIRNIETYGKDRD